VELAALLTAASTAAAAGVTAAALLLLLVCHCCCFTDMAARWDISQSTIWPCLGMEQRVLCSADVAMHAAACGVPSAHSAAVRWYVPMRD
jgi:hypothetical protein